MELTARIQQRDNENYDPLDKNGYYIETPCRFYVPFFQHVYKYTEDAEINNWRTNKKKTADRHTIYSLLICKRLFRKTIHITKKGPSNGDMFLIQWLAFDSTQRYYEDWKNLHNGETLEGKIPTAYNNFFNRNIDISYEQRVRYLDNGKFDDFYKQVIFDDFAKVISQLLKTYENYDEENSDFRINMHYNEQRTKKFETHRKYSIAHFRNVIWYAVGTKRTELSKKIIEDFDKGNYCESRNNCYQNFKDEIKTQFRRIITRK